MPNLHYLLFCMLGLVVPEGRKKAHLLPRDNDRQSTIQSLKKLDPDFTDTEANQSAKLLINVLIEVGRTAAHHAAGKAVGKAQKALQTHLKTTTHRKDYVKKLAKGKKTKPNTNKANPNTNPQPNTQQAAAKREQLGRKINHHTPKGPMKGKSIKHTFGKHGSHNTHQLKLYAKNSKQPVGQWLNDVKAEEFIAQNLSKLKSGPVTIELPKGLGRVINPDGTFTAATHVRLVPSGTGVKTAYPIIK